MALPISRLISGSVNLSPQAAAQANLNTALILGSTDVIDVSERWRAYADLSEVAADFSTTDPEYKAAALYFGQTPRPTSLYIGRWVESATAGLLRGGALSAAEKTISNWTSFTSATLTMEIDGSSMALTGIDLSAVTNLNGVASALTTAASGDATFVWDGTRFIVTSGTTGAGSEVGYATAGTLKDSLKLTSATAQRKIDGIDAEEPVDVVTIFDDRFGYRWYAVMFADSSPDSNKIIAVAEYIEATNHVFAVHVRLPAVMDASSTTDTAYLLKAGGYKRTLTVYSENTLYAQAAFLGRALTVNFGGSNTTITMMWKTISGVVAESLTTTEANNIQAKNCNVYATYENDTAIIQYGVMSSGVYWDEIHGFDWLCSRIQTDWWNQLRTVNKVPQTDAGQHQLVTIAQAACQQGVTNGLLAPGLWNTQGFGELQQGDNLDTGFYVYAPPVALQAISDREARKSVYIQIAAKAAGATHTADFLITVNR